jgi:hypothetical protein
MLPTPVGRARPSSPVCTASSRLPWLGQVQATARPVLAMRRRGLEAPRGFRRVCPCRIVAGSGFAGRPLKRLRPYRSGLTDLVQTKSRPRAEADETSVPPIPHARVAPPTQKSGAKARGRAYALNVASLSEPVPEYPQHEVVRCLACGKQLSTALARLGSLLCLDCRESDAQLNPELVALWQQRGAPF